MATRIISSIVGIAIGISILVFSHIPFVLNTAIAVFSVMGIYELYKANKCLEYKIFSAVAFAYCAVTPFIHYMQSEVWNRVVAVVAVMLMFAGYFRTYKEMDTDKLFYAVCVPLLMSFSMNSLYDMYRMSDEHGIVYIVLALCGAWIADSAAYFVGTFIGKHKLCPEISPKKTIEGFVGGLVFNGLFFIVFNLVYVSFFAKGSSVNYVSSFFLGLICALIGTVGDLTASLIKRKCGIKDYGKIMPGHGGVMDRFDSVLFVAPFMYTYLSIFNIYS